MRNQTVRELLDRSGYKHRYLAGRINVSTTTFTNFVAGRAGMQAGKLRQLSNILGLSMETLLNAHERAAEELRCKKNGHLNHPDPMEIPVNEDV